MENCEKPSYKGIKKMKLSIIVPVYNVENTLKRCVRSILCQDFNDFELLLIDDGSTDNSGFLADTIAEKDNRIKVYHKENGGLSDARNYGIERALGEYITFIDSDDEIKDGTLLPLMSILEKNPEYDIIEYPVLGNPGCNDEYIFQPGKNEYRDSLDWLSEYGLEHCWAWNKIYKRYLFDEIRFPLGKKYEDVYIIGELLKRKPFIATSNKGLYLYYKNNNGITSKETKDGLTTLLEAQITIVKALGIDTRQQRWHRLYLNMLTSQLHSYRKTGIIKLWPQRICVKRYTKNSDCIKAIMLNIFGLKNTCRIFKSFSKA